MTRRIIGICGFAGAGKTTVGNFLAEDYGFTPISFADKLKDAVASIFGWDREMIQGVTKESRIWRETPDPFWSKELGFEATPRNIMQKIGTDCMRSHFNSDIWVLTIKKALLDSPETDYVITDLRFQNEIKMLRDVGGKLWQIRRGEDPSWIADAISDNKYGTDHMAGSSVHESEWRWIGYNSDFDETIYNDSSVDVLSAKIFHIMNRLT